MPKPYHADWVVKLACGCLDKSPVKSGSRWCPRRHGYQEITGHYSHEWRARCTGEKCRYNQWCGQDETYAKRTAGRHEQSKPGHRVAVLYDLIERPKTVAVLRASMVGLDPELPIPVVSPRSSWPKWIRDLPDEPPF